MVNRAVVIIGSSVAVGKVGVSSTTTLAQPYTDADSLCSLALAWPDDDDVRILSLTTPSLQVTVPS